MFWDWVENERAFMVEYRFGSFNRYGVVTFFAHHGKMYRADFTAGGTCSMVATMGFRVDAIEEFEAYWVMLGTWKFLD